MVALKLLNTRGIPALESVNITTSGTTTTIVFNNHPYVNNRFAGGFWIKIGQTLASGTNVIQFSTTGADSSATPLYLPSGDLATAEDLESNGNAVHLCFYDSDTHRLQLIA